jgi:hypothetical protein
MTFTKQQLNNNGVSERERPFSLHHEAVFGSMGTVNYSTAGKDLIIHDGGVLLGGTFYTFDGDQRFTIPAASASGVRRYLCITLDKYNLGEPKFVISNTWEQDSETDYIATVLRFTITNERITTVERIGGNVPEIYKLLDNTNVNTASKIERLDKLCLELEEKMQSVSETVTEFALYKHSIFVQFTVMSGGIISPTDRVSLTFDIYSKKGSNFIDNPNNSKKPGFIEQVSKAFHNNLKQVDGKISTVNGDCKILDGSSRRGTSIWGVQFKAGNKMQLWYSDALNNNRGVWLSENGIGGLAVAATNLYTETIVRVL